MPKYTPMIVILIAMMGLGCNKKSGEPQPVGYTIYVAVRAWPDGQVVDPLYFIEADSLTIYDSIPRANAMWDIAASPDGQWIYTMVHVAEHADSIRKIDVRTKTTAWTVPSYYRVELNLLDDGRLLLNGPNELVRTSDGSVVEHFDDSLQRCQGPVSGTRVAAVVRETDARRVRGTDVVTGEVWGGYKPHLRSGPAVQVFRARLHPDGRRVLVIGPWGGFRQSAVVVGDLETGETLYDQHLYSPGGRIAINEEGTMALAMDPGGSGIWEGPTGFAVVDLVDLKQTDWFAGGAGQGLFLPGQQKAVLAPSPDYWSTPPGPDNGLAVVDLATMSGLPGAEWIHLSLPEPLVGAIGVGPRLSK